VDIRYVNPFVEGVNSVFQSMLSLEPRRCALKLDPQNGNGAALTSLVGISGQVQGVVALRFPSSTALQLARRMRGTTMAEINE
jgi:CheY-specific phosphatase CheX